MSTPIFLFENTPLKISENNPLKDFLYYLKFKGQTGVVNFSYSNEYDSLHKNMTIKENLTLDSVPISLIKDNEVNLREYIERINNPYLIKLVDTLGDLNKSVIELCPRDLKLTTLIKSILSEREYLFLVNPDNNLEQFDLKVLKSCLTFEAMTNHRKIFIKTSDGNKWMDTCASLISKDHHNNYIIKTNPFLSLSGPEIKLVA